MPVKIKPTSIIKADLGIQSGGPVHAFFTATCAKAMDKYVPKREGILRGTVELEVDRITYNQPYAHAQYVGYTTGEVRNYTTPGTGPYWDQRMWSAEKDSVVKQVQNYVNRGAK